MGVVDSATNKGRNASLEPRELGLWFMVSSLLRITVYHDPGV